MLLKNARLASGQPVDLLLKDGLIAAMGLDLAADGEEVLDCAGRTVLPAFVDLHCHWRTPGFEYKEDIATGSAAAAAGGYTFVNLMPNTKPVCSSADIAHSVMAEAERIGLCAANQTVSITQNFDGRTLDHLKTLPEDLKFITEDGKGVQSGNVMAKAFAIAAQRGLTIMSHAEDMDISPWDYRLAENIETVRNLHLSEYYGTRLHMCHVSTKEAVEAIGAAKWKGVPVTCEVTPHHLFLTEDAIGDDYNTFLKVNPPLRTAEDAAALIEGVVDGTVDAIVTDHAPHTEYEKNCEFELAPFGMTGLETALALVITNLVAPGKITWERAVELMAVRPRAILRVERVALEPGAVADLTVVDPEAAWTVEADGFLSKATNSGFIGAELTGRATDVYVAGYATLEDGAIVE